MPGARVRSCDWVKEGEQVRGPGALARTFWGAEATPSAALDIMGLDGDTDTCRRGSK